ncbi:MAG TPA: tripartite tricarboxylate transporter substrate binding protein [Ramlibacter sp.]|nr:tripartite tricarboxylate transporter substrate binding protein [Ramlibacter sp.]
MMTNPSFLRSCLAAIAVVAGAASTLPAAAQSWPTKPIKLIVASAPGGNIDLIARVLGDKLSASLGQPVVVENKAGAAGNIASELVAKAPPDGHTLLVVATSHSTNLHIYPKLSFDPVKDLTPVSQLGTSYFALVVAPSSPLNAVRDLVAMAKANRGRVDYASAGVGQANHLGMELLKNLAGIQMVHIPYTSMGAATTALMGQQVHASILSLPAVIPAAKTGKLKVLAVTGPKRSEQLPNVPTVAEAGYPAYAVTGWTGLLAPAGTPPAIIEKLHQETVKALRSPDAVERLHMGGLEPVASSPKEFDAFIKAEMNKWGKVVKAANIKAE